MEDEEAAEQFEEVNYTLGVKGRISGGEVGHFVVPIHEGSINRGGSIGPEIEESMGLTMNRPVATNKQGE